MAAVVMTAGVAVIAAMEREIRPLVRGWDCETRDFGGRQFKVYRRGSAVAISGGIGAAAARSAAEAAIAWFQPQVLISAGFAGALDPELKAGAVLKPRWIIDGSDGSRTEIEGGQGVLLSSSKLADSEQKARLAAAYSAQAIDMEAAGVVKAAQARGIMVLAVKAISDTAGQHLPPLERFIARDGSFREGSFLAFAAVRPWLWGRVFRLARNSTRAANTLCQALAAEMNERNSGQFAGGIRSSL